MLSNIIEPRISERKESEDGTIKWVTKKANTIINLPNNSIIIGEPGSGKSTLFKILSNEIIAQNSLRNNEDFYPIILTFKEVEKSDFCIEKAIENYFKKEWNKNLDIDFKQIIDNESCAIFIDALDELSQQDFKEQALNAVTTFTTKHSNIKVICSSRPSDYIFHNSESIGFKYLEISALNRRQVELFLNNYFSDNITKSKSLLKSLRDSEILEKLPKTPLTIALITMLFDEKEVEIPATITDLYEMFVNLLIGKSSATDTTDLIEVGVKHRIISYIAKDLHSNLKSSISKTDLHKLVTAYSEERGQKLNVNQILNEILDQVGLFYINDKGEIAFKHQSFQEYFTAYEIFHHRQSDRKLFINEFNNLWWQNVAIFYGGMGKDSPKFLDEILEHSKPQNLPEFISNTGGIGKLLQALYNTPIKNRKKGIQRGLENTTSAINFLLSDKVDRNKKDIIFWQNFSKYGLMQIFGGWFKHSNWSITLVEPLCEYFDQKINTIEDSEDFNIEFELFLVSSILASDSFINFERLGILVDKSKLNNLELLAIIDTHLKQLDNYLPNHLKKNDKIRNIKKKVRKKIQSIPKFSEYVNKPINKIELE